METIQVVLDTPLLKAADQGREAAKGESIRAHSSSSSGST
jgi:hypothetical protein